MQFTSLATDDFTGTDGAEIGANWDSGYTGMQEFGIITNQCAALGNGDGTNDNTTVLETYNAVSWPNNQYGQIMLTDFPACSMMGIVLRCTAPSTLTYYRFETSHFNGSGASIGISKSIAGSFTTLADDDVTAWTNGNTLKGAVLGTSLSLFKDDVEVLTATDSAISAGRVGITMLYFTNCSGTSGLSLKGDDWVGGETSADEADTIIHRLMLLGVGR